MTELATKVSQKDNFPLANSTVAARYFCGSSAPEFF